MADMPLKSHLATHQGFERWHKPNNTATKADGVLTELETRGCNGSWE